MNVKKRDEGGFEISAICTICVIRPLNFLDNIVCGGSFKSIKLYTSLKIG